LLLFQVRTYLGAIDPSSWTKPDRITKGIDEYKQNAGIVGRMIDIVRICKRQGTVELIRVLVFKVRAKIRRRLPTSNATLITRHERTSVSLLPYRSTSQVSIMVQPIFRVLSIPPIINVNLRSMPRLMKMEGK
jgi:hypothetical protein